MNELALAACLLVIGILFSGLFSGAETGAYLFSRTRHQLMLSEGLSRARRVERLTVDLTKFVAICLVGTNLANALVSFSTTLAVKHLEFSAPELIATVTMGPVLFLLGEVTPKELFRRRPDRLLYAAAPILTLAGWLFRPMVWSLGLVVEGLRFFGLRAEDGRDLQGEDALRHDIAAGAEGGSLTSYQAILARNIFSLRWRQVRHAMIPVRDVYAIEVTTGIEEARELARQSGRRRYPVYRRTPDNVVGMIDLYDLLFEERPGMTVRNYVEPVLQVRPNERVAEALVRLRRARTNLAVVSAGERTLGIITIKDLVEEITGELQDL